MQSNDSGTVKLFETRRSRSIVDARGPDGETQPPAIEARAGANYPSLCVTACGGILFFKDRWTAVPAHEVESAKKCPYLEVREIKDAAGSADVAGV